MPSYPETRRSDTVEVLHGRTVADPYRWLEDPDGAETRAWVGAQNAVTEEYLAGLPSRAWFADTMLRIVHQPRAGVPAVHGGRYVVSRNDGRQDQDVWYVADSLADLVAGGRVLVDPNTFSADGTSSLSSLTLSHDGRLAAFGVSDGGSDWATFRLAEVATGEPVADAAIQTKFSAAEWLPDGRSYAYVDFPHPGAADGTQTAALPGPQLRVHRVGDPQEADPVLLAFPENDQLMMWPELSGDRRFLVVTIVEGTENRNRLWLYPVLTEDGQSRVGAPVKLVDEPVAEVVVLAVAGDEVLLRTDLAAPRGRIVRAPLVEAGADGREGWRDVVPEAEGTLLDACATASGLVVVHLVDARPEVRRFSADGEDLGAVPVEGGSVVALEGREQSDECFIGFSSVTSPTTSYRLDAATGEIESLPGLVPAAEGGLVPPQVRVERHRARSADGTAVPYFLVRPAGADAGRPRPTLLWGYGGFKIPILADYRPGWSGWLAAGGQVALANLRGGGEFGTDWYEAGRLDRKQNVFDDFVAVAEDLVATGATTSGQLAVHGRSNGGLLVGAVLTQRPDLMAAAVPAVGVLDMLRFHLFTVGAAWMSDYGDPGDPEQFDVALRYSPLHNVRPGTAYPATLVLTGDHDDRVVPLHSHKFTAALQRAQAGDAPVLTRIETATGHGMGKPSALVASEWADLLAFAAEHTGLTPPAGGPADRPHEAELSAPAGKFLP